MRMNNHARSKVFESLIQGNGEGEFKFSKTSIGQMFVSVELEKSFLFSSVTRSLPKSFNFPDETGTCPEVFWWVTSGVVGLLCVGLHADCPAHTRTSCASCPPVKKMGPVSPVPKKMLACMNARFANLCRVLLGYVSKVLSSHLGMEASFWHHSVKFRLNIGQHHMLSQMSERNWRVDEGCMGKSNPMWNSGLGMIP